MVFGASAAGTSFPYDLARVRESAGPAPPRRVLVVGDLDYGVGTTFLPLPGTSEETERVVQLANAEGLQTLRLRGTEATHTAITEKIQDATIVHIATHGGWADSTSKSVADVFRSARVALSQANSGAPESLLSAEDITYLDLSKVQLVTLSACASGQGRPIDGQGLLGFQTAFMAAGARSLLISLWPVPDEPTSKLMQAFYEALWRTPSISKAEALRRAQLQLRSNPRYADPQNWVAWVLVGEAW